MRLREAHVLRDRLLARGRARTRRKQRARGLFPASSKSILEQRDPSLHLMYTQPAVGAERTQKSLGAKPEAAGLANTCCGSTGHGGDQPCPEHRCSSLAGSWPGEYRPGKQAAKAWQICFLQKKKKPQTNPENQIPVHALAGREAEMLPGCPPCVRPTGTSTHLPHSRARFRRAPKAHASPQVQRARYGSRYFSGASGNGSGAVETNPVSLRAQLEAPSERDGGWQGTERLRMDVAFVLLFPSTRER